MTGAAIARQTLSLASIIPRTVSVVQPNGSRLSCGRNAHRRKAAEPRARLGGRGNAIVPHWRAPTSFKRMLGSTGSAPSLEELHLLLVPFGPSPGGKCPEVPSLTDLGILV